MIEAYAFLAAFTVQILVVSVLSPAWLTRYARAKAEAQLPGLDRKSLERLLTAYRAANMGIAVLGLGLLGWLFNHMQSPDWDIRPVTLLHGGYTMLQILPFALAGLIGEWAKKKALAQSPQEVKRTASLKRRGLFDVVSPFTVFLAVLGYALFVAFVVYIRQHPFPGFTGYRSLSAVTLVCTLNAFAVYFLLYHRRKWPLETSAYRVRAVGVQIKLMFYVSIAVIVFQSLNLALRLLDMLRWAPFVMSVYFVIIILLCSMIGFALRRQADADRLGVSPAS